MTLCTQDEAKWQIDFLGGRRRSISSTAKLDGYPLLHPEGRFSKEQIRRINTTILNQVGPKRMR
jgi:hypothetical protein